jgi:tRNA threonylcarbamoyladenosine biosynthesis protein TsaE
MFERYGTALQMNVRETPVRTVSADETRSLGATLAEHLQGGAVVLLHGPLGAGKTVFVSGMAAALGSHTWRGSPTFALIHEYETTPALIHADLYRLTEREADGLGLEEYVRPDSILVCEWPERADTLVRSLAGHQLVEVFLDYLAEDERSARIIGFDIGAVQ